MLSKLESLLSGFNCDKDITILIKVFSDFKIKEYFKILCEKLGITNFEEFAKLTEKDIKDENILIFFNNCKTTAVIFEGCYNHRVSFSDTQVALIAGLYNGLYMKYLFNEIPLEKQLDSEQYLHITRVSKGNLKNTSDLNAVMMDAYAMFPYWCTVNSNSINGKITDHNRTMHQCPIELSINSVILKLKQTNWKTRWGKMKSFHRNFPRLLDNLQSQLNGENI